MLMIFWTNDNNIEWIIWFFKKIVDNFWSKNSILVDFLGNRNEASAGWNGDFSLKDAFFSDKCLYQPPEAPSLIYRKSTNMLFFDHTWSTIFMKIQLIHSILRSLVQYIINITFVSHISCKIWIYFKIDGKILSKNSFLAGFLQIRDGASAGWYWHLSLKNAF